LSKEVKSVLVLIEIRRKEMARPIEIVKEDLHISPTNYDKAAEVAENSQGVLQRDVPPSDEGIIRK